MTELAPILENQVRDSKPFLKWAGGKRSLLPQLMPRVPVKFGTYHEPFVGGGALFFALSSAGRIGRARLNDINERLARTYRAIQGVRGVDLVEGIIYRLRRMKNDKAFFLKQRARAIDSEDDVAVAAWMIYLNKTCYNGLYRVNQRGIFNAPFGAYENPQICDAMNLRACAWALGGDEGGPGQVTISSLDFEQALAKVQRGDFVYLDPPYLPRSGVEFVGYDAKAFGIEEHRVLRDHALELKKRGAHVLISNSGADEVRELYASGFVLEEVRGKRSIGADASRRTHAPDLLIW